MSRSQLIALLAASYLVVVFAWHRLRLHLARRAGLPIGLLRRFDHRVLLSELLLPAPGEGAPAPLANAPAAPAAYARSPWELPEPPAFKDVRDRLRAGETPPLPDPDALRRSLYLHFAVRRLLAGDFDGAEAIGSALEDDAGERVRALVWLARAERFDELKDPSSARAAALKALEHAERAGDPTPGLQYLVAHLRLGWMTDLINLELSTVSVARALRRALDRWGDRPFLHFALAHAHALLGRADEALDALGRALYHSEGDPFYARAVLDSPYVAQARPALAAQCRALCEGRPPRAAPKSVANS